ncbi:MAG: thrombospondin type 3 repeat-containing protein [Labilithrix sp.]|nr:thrombospondin type 3 repeat-containing protein [Labilithrix sp.]MCW5814697.1 thrombospondin type 3 repeat-containing protein [Labilithrix sp.]
MASGAAHAIGMLKTGYLADIAVYDGSTNKDFRAVIDGGVEDVALVLRGGTALYGDTPLITDPAVLPPATSRCAPWPGDVCGKEKTACIDVRASSNPPTLATVLEAGTKFYPTFFCKNETPTDEPSCHPSRPGVVRGSTVYDGNPTESDKDGDGIPDDRDNCPLIFNPVRPMDGGNQADSDNDGIGDACDECPNDGSQECDHLSGADIDGDGVPNGIDNCLTVANADQADADDDGIGDACDTCAESRSGADPCDYPISTVRNPAAAGHPDVPSVVAVEGIVSAKLASTHLYIQETVEGGPWQGIYLQADALAGNASTGPRLGQKVRAVGLHKNPFDQDQITLATITVIDTAVTPAVPLLVNVNQINTAARAAAEPYESLLVRVDGSFVVTDPNLNGVKDAAHDARWEMEVSPGGLRIHDQLFRRFGNCGTTGGQLCPYPAPGFEKDATFSSFTGIMGWSFSQRKLYPRNAADLVR